MSIPRFHLTQHAVDRYMERVARHSSPSHARKSLEGLIKKAKPLKVKVSK